MALRPINRIKHVVDKQSALVAGTSETTTLINAVDAPILANTAEVVTGATVNAIYLKVEAYSTSTAALANFYMLINKNPSADIPSPEPNVVGANDAKKYVIHQEMVMMQQVVDGNPRTIFNGVIVIPKHYRRFGPSDLLQIKVLTPGVSAFYCFQCHFKEFR